MTHICHCDGSPVLKTSMSSYRRVFIPGGCYFFTVNLLDRRGNLLVTQIQYLRHAVRQVRVRRPFQIDAWVILPDHLHCVWTLPPDDADYATRWKEIKALFSRSLPKTETVSKARAQQGERGIWQHRYWEHAIRNERDHVSHIDYCYINPFKHGLVEKVRDWPYSTFHRDVKKGIYSENWACESPDIEAGE
jgi:putative transposase